MENQIRALRKERGISQEDLARRCGVSRQTINAIPKIINMIPPSPWPSVLPGSWRPQWTGCSSRPSDGKRRFDARSRAAPRGEPLCWYPDRKLGVELHQDPPQHRGPDRSQAVAGRAAGWQGTGNSRHCPGVQFAPVSQDVQSQDQGMDPVDAEHQGRAGPRGGGGDRRCS